MTEKISSPKTSINGEGTTPTKQPTTLVGQITSQNPATIGRIDSLSPIKKTTGTKRIEEIKPLAITQISNQQLARRLYLAVNNKQQEQIKAYEKEMSIRGQAIDVTEINQYAMDFYFSSEKKEGVGTQNRALFIYMNEKNISMTDACKKAYMSAK